MGKAAPTRDSAMRACIQTIQRRLVEVTSTSGAHRGFSIHGSLIKLVQSPSAPSVMPIFVYMVPAMPWMIITGTPCRK